MSYVEEISAPRTIRPADTSVGAFVGRAAEGPVNTALPVTGDADFERQFGPASASGGLGVALLDFFRNGGHRAVVVRAAGRLRAGPSLGAGRAALRALEQGPDFDLLCVLPDAAAGTVSPALLADAVACCERRRAMLLMDSPGEWSGSDGVARAVAAAATFGMSPNAALYFPRMTAGDGRSGGVSAIGAIAGAIARADLQRGVWRAPAGIGVHLSGLAPALPLDERETVRLASAGVNAVRTFLDKGACVWGARTRASFDGTASDFSYIPVRRTALLIEKSLDRGLEWVVFERNDEDTWRRVRALCEDFMLRLFAARAFAGNKPDQAFFVRCDASTCGPDSLGVSVGFAPLQPAEFVVLRLHKATAA